MHKSADDSGRVVELTKRNFILALGAFLAYTAQLFSAIVKVCQDPTRVRLD